MITYKLNIGDRLKNDTRDLTITNRKIVEKIYGKKNGKQYNKSEIYYQFICNKCGYDSSEYYISGVLYKEYWILQGGLINKGYGCPCCNKSHRITVSHINSIVSSKKTEWMIPYFQGGYNEAKKYTANSNKMKYFICPHCGRIKDKQIHIDFLAKTGYLPCICGDGISYPNKYGFELFNNQLKDQIQNFIREYSPDWAKRYSYDFYFEKDSKKYICEFEGGLGHGGYIHTNSKITKEETIEIDRIKDNLAKNNGVELIRIDTSVSNSDYISKNILNSKLKNILDFSKVDFKNCDIFACSNLMKSVCFDYENNQVYYHDLTKKYGLSEDAIRKYIKHGRKIGWCKREYIRQEKTSQKIRMYSSDGSYEVFKSAVELEKISCEKFGIKFNRYGIYAACNGTKKTYRGYRFEYITDEEVVA